MSLRWQHISVTTLFYFIESILRSTLSKLISRRLPKWALGSRSLRDLMLSCLNYGIFWRISYREFMIDSNRSMRVKLFWGFFRHVSITCSEKIRRRSKRMNIVVWTVLSAKTFKNTTENLQSVKNSHEDCDSQAIEISISDRIWSFIKNTRSINQNNVWQ